MCLSVRITSSSALIERSRPTNSGTIMCGKTTISRSGRTGNSSLPPVLSLLCMVILTACCVVGIRTQRRCAPAAPAFQFRSSCTPRMDRRRLVPGYRRLRTCRSSARAGPPNGRSWIGCSISRRINAYGNVPSLGSKDRSAGGNCTLAQEQSVGAGSGQSHDRAAPEPVAVVSRCERTAMPTAQEAVEVPFSSARSE